MARRRFEDDGMRRRHALEFAGAPPRSDRGPGLERSQGAARGTRLGRRHSVSRGEPGRDRGGGAFRSSCKSLALR
jgi:hypothetical protein